MHRGLVACDYSIYKDYTVIFLQFPRLCLVSDQCVTVIIPFARITNSCFTRRRGAYYGLVMSYSYSRHIMQVYSYFCSFRGDVSIMIYIYISFVVIGDEYKTFQELHVMYRIYHPILKFYQMLRVVPRHNPIREIYHNPIRNSYRMIRTIPSVIPAYPTSVQTSVNQALRQPSRTHQFKSSHPPKALYTVHQ